MGARRGRPTMRLERLRGARAFRRRNSSRRCGGTYNATRSRRAFRRPESGIYRYIQVQVQVQVQARGSRARTARRRFQWSYSPASTMSSTAPSWSVNAHAPAPKRFRTYASLGARRGFRRCFFESGPAAPLGPCARSSGRVLNLLDAFPPAAPPASPCAARLRGAGRGHVPRRPPTRRRELPQLEPDAARVAERLGPERPVAPQRRLLRPAVGARHARPRRGLRGGGRERALHRLAVRLRRAHQPRGVEPDGRWRRRARAAAGPGAGPSLLATEPPPGSSRGPP